MKKADCLKVFGVAMIPSEGPDLFTGSQRDKKFCGNTALLEATFNRVLSRSIKSFAT